MPKDTFIDFNDGRIPIGKRKVAYIRWAISKGTPKIKALKQANKKFGFERKGRIVVFMHDADCMDYASMRDVPWDRACGLDARKWESAIVVPDCTYAPFDMVSGMFSFRSLVSEYPRPKDGEEGARKWAKEHGYQFKSVRITP